MDAFFHFLGYIPPFILVLTILVFVHEMGHYLVARYNKVKVEVFSIGFGPELFGWNDKAGTRWKVSLLPFGGYVKMFGDADASSRPDAKLLGELSQDLSSSSLHGKTVWQRIAVTAAGPLANYLFAIVIFAAVLATVGERFTLPILGEISPGSVAEQVGLKPGDRVLSLEGKAVGRFEDLVEVVRQSPGVVLALEIQRGSQTHRFSVMPEAKIVKDYFGSTYRMGQLGVKPSGEAGFVPQSVLLAFKSAVVEVFLVSWRTLEAIAQMIIGVRSGDEVGGVFSIAKMSGDVVGLGLPMFFWFMGLLSINLGLINLFPIPMLDGGHLLFYGIEAVRGRPLSEKAQEVGFRIGLACVLGLLLFSTWNDLVRLKVVQWVVGLFQ